ncbi:MAG: ABC transporter permease [Pleomorphochaeta sp.]
MKILKNKAIIVTFITSLIAILLGAIISSLLIALSGQSPLAAFRTLIVSGFGTSGKVWPIWTTLGQSTPLILTGLAAMISFRVGVFCIAQESQYIGGAIVAAWLGASLTLPAIIAIPLILVCSMLFGYVIGYIPGAMKAKLGVNEIISSIMINEIFSLVLEYLVAFPLRADSGQKAQSAVINKAYWLPQFVNGSRWGISFIVSMIFVVIVYFYIFKSSRGYEIRMVGQNPTFAQYGGINSTKVIIRTLCFSGSVAALAGGMEVLGNYHRIMTGFSSGIGFDGLSIAMLGASHPFGVSIVAILLAGIRQGAQIGLQIDLHVPRELGGVLIALIIIFVACQKIYLPKVEKLVDKLFYSSVKEEV